MKQAQRPIVLDPRRRKPARRREGAVLLIVLLMVMMATGTALYAMQATFYEQGASTSYAEAAWTRSLAEGAAVGTFTVVEEDGIQRGGLAQNLDQRWRDTAGVRSEFSTKYGTPTPLEGTALPIANPDSARSIDHEADNDAFVNTPQGLNGFCRPAKWLSDPPPGGPPVIAPAPFDGMALGSRRRNRCRAIYETWGGLGTGSSSTAAGVTTPPRPRTRSVITGIGETFLTTDQMDPDGVRGLHETVGMARGYFDRLN